MLEHGADRLEVVFEVSSVYICLFLDTYDGADLSVFGLVLQSEASVIERHLLSHIKSTVDAVAFFLDELDDLVSSSRAKQVSSNGTR